MVQVRPDGPPRPAPTSTASTSLLGGTEQLVDQLLAVAAAPPSPADVVVGPTGPSAARSAALDLHEGICDPPPPREGCPRWPKYLQLRWQRGELSGFVEGRCGATNKCAYCQRLYVVETVEMLTLDAMEHAPLVWMVLTAREHLTRADCYGHLRQLRRTVKRSWADAEWFVQVEFQRRGALHLNLLIKGVPVDQLQELHDVVVTRWCERVDAEPVGQWSGVVGDGVGVVRYISKMLAHGLKAEQAPPLGWRGHRTSQTRGYLVRPASVMRQEARQALRRKRELWKVMQGAPELDAATVEDIVDELLERASERSWELVIVDVEAMRRRRAALAPLKRGRHPPTGTPVRASQRS